MSQKQRRFKWSLIPIIVGLTGPAFGWELDQRVHFFCEDEQSAQMYTRSVINGFEFPIEQTTCRYNSILTVPIRLDLTTFEYKDKEGRIVSVWRGNLLDGDTLLWPQVYVFLTPDERISL